MLLVQSRSFQFGLKQILNLSSHQALAREKSRVLFGFRGVKSSYLWFEMDSSPSCVARVHTSGSCKLNNVVI